MEEYSLRIHDGTAPPAYEAVQIVRRPAQSTRGKLLTTAGGTFLALVVLGAVLLAADKRESGASTRVARAVSEAVKSLSFGKIHGAQSLQGTPGVIPSPPTGGYSIYDAHYSEDVR